MWSVIRKLTGKTGETLTTFLHGIAKAIRRNEQRKRDQAEKGYGSLRYFVFNLLQEGGVKDAENVSAKVGKAFVTHSNWRQSEADLRELRTAATFAVCAVEEDMDRVAGMIDRLFSHLEKTFGGK